MGPESPHPEEPPQSEVILRRIGKEFYDQCSALFERASTRELRGHDAELATEVNQNPLLQRYSQGDGRLAEYKNSLAQPCEIAVRQSDTPELAGAIEFCISKIDDDIAGVETIDDWIDSYLISPSGDILAAEHRKVVSDHPKYEFGPIEIDAEVLLHKIRTEFVPAESDR
jgi:hypothetical protein